MLDHFEPTQLGRCFQQGGLRERRPDGRRHLQSDDLNVAGQGHEVARVHWIRREQSKKIFRFNVTSSFPNEVRQKQCPDPGFIETEKVFKLIFRYPLQRFTVLHF